jgi:hypothetical protein
MSVSEPTTEAINNVLSLWREPLECRRISLLIIREGRRAHGRPRFTFSAQNRCQWLRHSLEGFIVMTQLVFGTLLHGLRGIACTPGRFLMRNVGLRCEHWQPDLKNGRGE